MLPIVYRFLHVFSAMLFTSGVVGAHVTGLIARRSGSWPERAALFGLIRRLGLFLALPGLLLAGFIGQLLAMGLGYRMSDTPAFMIANGLWLLLALATFALEMPSAAKLATLAGSAAGAAGAKEPDGWAATAARWRIGNAVQLVLFLALLWVMVAPWKV